MPSRTDRDVLPLTIVLLGGIASGKSTVASLLEKRGAVVLDADRLAHEELETPEVVAAVRGAWGDRVFAQTRVDRRKLGEVVFQDPKELKKLEELIHPRVLARIAARVRELAVPEGERRSVVVLDVPLAAQANVGDSTVAHTADLRVFVEADTDTRRRRAREIRGWTEGELERREARQLSLSEKKSMADAVIRNDGGVPEAEGDVQRFWSSFVEPRLQERRR